MYVIHAVFISTKSFLYCGEYGTILICIRSIGG